MLRETEISTIKPTCIAYRPAFALTILAGGRTNIVRVAEISEDFLTFYILARLIWIPNLNSFIQIC